MGYLIKGKKVLWAGPTASRRGGTGNVLTTFYKNREVMLPPRPRPSAGPPGGRVTGVRGAPAEGLVLPAGVGGAVVGAFHGVGSLVCKEVPDILKLFFLKQKPL